MTLLQTILKRVVSQESVAKKYSSPPPEIDEDIMKPTKKRYVSKYSHVRACVDTSPPRLDATYSRRQLTRWSRQVIRLQRENMDLVMAIRREFLNGGRVDSHWEKPPPGSRQYYENRLMFLKRIEKENNYLYNKIISTTAKVTTAAAHRQQWSRDRHEILNKAHCTFVLFSPIPQGEVEDLSFIPPLGVKRPRVYLTLRIRGGATIGELCIELFTDVCPLTCQLFTELLLGDHVGYSYVGTCFFRKVPKLYWCGGDVVHNNGFGCYAQKGLRRPIGAENYHFSHSMPGLVSMRVTPDDEVCSSFNITFKPLTQFDLQNIVFARVVRPSDTYSYIRNIGSALSSQPAVEVAGTRCRVRGRWLYGRANTKLTSLTHLRRRCRDTHR